MRLVMKYYVSDDCSYGYDLIEPIEYDSPEAACVDFEKLCRHSMEIEQTLYIGEVFVFAS